MTEEQAKKLAARVRSEVNIWTDECISEIYCYNATFGIIHQAANMTQDVMCIFDPANKTLEELLNWLEREEATLKEWWKAVQENGYKADFRTYERRNRA